MIDHHALKSASKKDRFGRLRSQLYVCVRLLFFSAAHALVPPPL